MVQLNDISLSFGGHTLFDEVSFTLQKGERCGLVGKNGSGKSTLFRLIDKEMEPDNGTISIPKNYRIGYLTQHIHFTEATLLEEAATGLQPHEKDHLYKAEKILFGLGFTQDDLYAPLDSFSGGYHLRLHLAKVLISEPDCLLLDEPTNYLDILSIRWLSNFLKKWQGEFILITHDREFMDSVSTHTIGIHRGKVKKIKGSSIDFFQQILLEEEILEKTREKIEKKKAHLQNFIDRFGAKASKASQAQSKKKMLEREPTLEKLNALSNLSFSFHEANFPGKKMLDANGVYFSYTEEPIIEDVSLEVEKGERIAIIGKNGRGKSTFLKLLCKELSPKEGTVNHSENIRLGYFGQTHIDRLHKEHTIEEEIATANPALTYTEIKGIAGVMMFSGSLSEKPISVLSGGEKSRVLLGKIVAKPCNILFLDEPTHHLDIESIEALIDALEDFTGTVVIVTHTELILRRLNLDKIILCEEAKQTVFLGNYDEFLEKIGWEEEKKGSSKKEQPKPRKERADFVNKRAAALRPIEKEIEDNESRLARLEKEDKVDQKAIESGDTNPGLLKGYGQRREKIMAIENRLLELYESRETARAQWDS